MPLLAANLSMMFNEVEFLDRFAAAAQAGFTAVEFLFPYAYPAEAIAEQLDKYKLQQVLFNLPPGNWDAGERGLACLPGRGSQFQDGLGQAFEYAKMLKCKRLHCMAGLLPAGLERAAAHATYVENLSYAARAAFVQGVELTIEPINSRDIPGFFINTSKQAIAVLDEVKAPNLGLQYDIYHMQIMEGDLAPTIDRLLPRIAHMQLADTPGRHEPGTGEINYEFLLPYIDRVGYLGAIGCEYRPAAGTVEGLGWARPYLSK